MNKRLIHIQSYPSHIFIFVKTDSLQINESYLPNVPISSNYIWITNSLESF